MIRRFVQPMVAFLPLANRGRAHLRFIARVYPPNPPRHRRGLQKVAIRPVGHRVEMAGCSISRIRSVNKPQMRPTVASLVLLG